MIRSVHPYRRGLGNWISFWLAGALLVFLAVFPSSAQTWEAIGPSGGDVRALVADPSHPEFVYLGTTDGHIFGSRDAGSHWSLLGQAGAAGNAIVTAILIDPHDSNTVIASTWTREQYGEGGGVFLSRDSGKTWRDSGLAGHAVRALVEAPSDPDILIAGALDGVFRSRDRGVNWERISPANDPEIRDLDSLSIDPQNPEIIYAGTFHLPWRTLDGGQSWQPIHRGMIDDSDVLSLAIDPTNPQRAFASACSGIYRSDDAGSLWQKIQGIPYSSRRTPVLRMDPSNHAILYAGTTEGLWKSDDGGATWRRISPLDWVINSLAVIPPAEGVETSPEKAFTGRILVGTEQHGVLLSDDGGENFHPSNDGFHHRRVVSLAANPEKPASIAAVLADSADPIVVTADGGRTWSSLSAGLEPANIRRIYSADSGWVVALASGGLAHYDSEKAAWARIGSELGSCGITPVLAGRGNEAGQAKTCREPFATKINDLTFSDNAWFAATDAGLFVSRDRGADWAALPFAPIELPVESVRASRDGTKLRIVSSRAMLFSDDAGETWDWHDLPLEAGGVLRVEFAGPSTALAVAGTGLYISRDSGWTWRRAQSGLPQVPVSDIFIGPELWLASLASGGLYFSRDQGTTWSRVRRDSSPDGALESSQFPALLVESSSSLVLVGSGTEGLYILDLPRTPAIVSARASSK